MSTTSPSGKPTPKERGCFQCSRRRINCDKHEPTCNKCAKKGIECSGVNRIRFTTGVARRGKLKDCKIPNISDSTACLPSELSFSTIVWDDERKRGIERRRGQRTAAQQHPNPARSVGSAHGCGQSKSSPKMSPNKGQQLVCHLSAASELEDGVEEIDRVEEPTLQRLPTHQNLQPWIPPLSAEARMLFSYFSTAIAPVMVVIDTKSNGYREFILPMAFDDEVLRRAVGVVAAQHLSRERPEIKGAAEAGRAAIISRLRKDAISATEDQVFSKYTWATLLVLLVGETVTGSEDYGFLVQMLLCLSANSRTEDANTGLIRFLQTQTNL